MIWEKLKVFEKHLPPSRKEALKVILEKIDKEGELEEFLEKEHLFSPSIGKGILLYKKKGGDGILIGTCEKVFDYEPFDTVPPKILVVLFLPDEEKTYISTLSRLFHLMNQSSVREGIMEAKSLEELRQIIKKEEEELFRE
ncbi:hypothetical protein DRQ20_02335 [bacterium]|mgnify:CR=1 FL=1|nr:MAG: hypothetical protein DRQ18_01645 [bacterium]RKZ26696.1 MAG: hypothetical protein DRQ20_02335 [bacterium]